MEQVFKHFNMTPNPSIQTPLNDNLDVLIAEEESERTTIITVTTNFQYREILGSLLYDMIVMRPDLMPYHMRTIHAR